MNDWLIPGREMQPAQVETDKASHEQGPPFIHQVPGKTGARALQKGNFHRH